MPPLSLTLKTVLVTGGSRGLGAVICEKFAAQGANVAINYASSASDAETLAKQLVEKHGITAKAYQADCGVIKECEELVAAVVKDFGGLDVLVGNAGWTKMAQFNDLHALSEEDWDKCWAVNVKGQMALFRAALPTFNAAPHGGSFILTSSIAGASIGGSSLPYSVTKAAQNHLMRCLAQTQGSNVRVNSVLPGLLLTEWGARFGEEQIANIKARAVLKKETDLEDCADMYVAIAKNSSMTGQRVQVDSGLNVAMF